MMLDDNPLGDTHSLKIAPERPRCTSVRGLVPWGTQKIPQKGDLRLVFACNDATLLCPEFFPHWFSLSRRTDGYESRDGGMQSRVAFLRNTGAFRSPC